MVGLDAGTTGVKAVAFGVGARWRAVAIREYPLLHPAPDQEVQDPSAVVKAAAAALAECVAAAGGATVLGVSLSAAMHGLMALDADRRPLTPIVTWADGRAGPEAVALARSPQSTSLRGSTGTPIHPMAPMAKLLWFSRHDRETWAAARWWVGLKDYLLLWLTDEVVTEVSSASGTGLLDNASRTWSPSALSLCGLEVERLPPVLPTTSVLPMAPGTAADLGLRPGTPVVVGAGDGPLANLGTGAVDPGVAALSLGTSGAVRLTVDGPRTDPGGGLFCYALADPLWVVGGALSNGGDVLRWAARTLNPGAGADNHGAGADNPDAAALDLAASVPPGSDGLVMLPFLLPERAPVWAPDVTAAYLGLRHDHTRAHLVRAAVEGVCLQMRLMLDRVDRVYPVETVRATGGALRSPLWRDLLAAALDRPLSVVGEAEGSALGAASLGMVALGKASSLHEALDWLAPPGAGEGAPVQPSTELAESFSRLRSRIPRLLDSLARTVARDTGAGADP